MIDCSARIAEQITLFDTVADAGLAETDRPAFIQQYWLDYSWSPRLQLVEIEACEAAPAWVAAAARLADRTGLNIAAHVSRAREKLEKYGLRTI